MAAAGGTAGSVELSLLGIRLFLGLSFVSSSVPKLVAPIDFRRARRNYQLLPVGLVRPVAVWLPRFELLLGALLLTGVAVRVAASLAAGALLTFSVAIALNLARGRKIDCGCFSGSSRREITWRLVAWDVALSATAIAVAMSPPPVWIGAESVAVFVVVVGLFVSEYLIAESVRLRRAIAAAIVDHREAVG
ncbi:MAG: DoxX family membrane protein [Actinobacteria bacterium]|nr:DoxX family membrane protein [Actinomycetota bacterium]